MTGTGIFAAPAPRLVSIDAGRPFLLDLAQGLSGAAADGGPFALADMDILVPTRRAARALADAFAATNSRRAILLPRIRPLGDIDEDEILLEPGAAEELPPAISPLERRLVLARLVAAAEKTFSGQESWPAAIAAADELAALLDSFFAEEVDFARLGDLVPQHHAAHWERSLAFLRIVTEAWPAYLAERDCMDPSDRRARLIDLEAMRLARGAPDRPVIVAGTTGSAPAVARLMRVVAALPRGLVVLPGLDRALREDAKAWDAIEDPHPQAGLKALLTVFGSDPPVAPWPQRETSSPRRASLLSLALRPANATDDWRDLVIAAAAEDPALASAVSGLSLVEAADEEAEAATIAVILREAIETPGRTAMLVTPDRNLSRRVAAKMRRWGIAVDDSAGVPFSNSPCGTYLRLVASWLIAPADPHAILSLAKAPLAGFGLDEGRRCRAVAALDEGLRGLAPGPGLSSVETKLAARPRLAAHARPAIDVLASAAKTWPVAATADFAALLDAHLEAAETVAAAAGASGPERLWRGEDGEAGALLLADLRASAASIGAISIREYPRAFSQILSGASVRRRAPAHPRLSIFGPLEARLQSADIVVLGGLNEGVWPGDAGADPFLSRPMRAALGLPSPERRIGLAAHDFAQGAAAPTVVLTRAMRVGGAPSKPSRWIVRLKNILAGAGALAGVDASERLSSWAASLDAAGQPRPAAPPRPTPPASARPRALSVTRIEKWIRDPYAIYARYVLGLRKLDPLAETFGARHLGLLLHKVFERGAREGADDARLAAILKEEAPGHGLGALAAAFWGPTVDAAIDWFEAFHVDRLAKGRPVILEGKGATRIDAKGGPFELSANADRIDLLSDGSAFLIDYKSRNVPTEAQMEKFRVQLPLTALIVGRGGFETLGPIPVAGYQYIRTVRRRGGGDETGAEGPEAVAVTRAAAEGLYRWIDAYDDPGTPYLSQPRPEFVDDFGDYDHLARRRERESGGEDP